MLAVPAAFGAIAADSGVTGPCVTSVPPRKTRYERAVPAAIGVAPRLKTVTLTGTAVPGNAALGMFGSMYGIWKKPSWAMVCAWRRIGSDRKSVVEGY